MSKETQSDGAKDKLPPLEVEENNREEEKEEKSKLKRRTSRSNEEIVIEESKNTKSSQHLDLNIGAIHFSPFRYIQELRDGKLLTLDPMNFLENYNHPMLLNE